MKLSVIIPVYRVEETLDRCVESVAQQTFTDLEIILVDDGSPDQCPQKCDAWARRDARISVIHKANGGLSDARNAGLEWATGDRITFVDSDDFLDSDTYRLVLQTDADIVEFPFYRHFGAPGQQKVVLPPHTYDDAADYWLRGRAYEHCYAWNKIFRRSLFDGVRFPKGLVFEDVWTLPLLLRKAQHIVTTSKGLYYYRANPQGITATAKGLQLEMLLNAHLKAMEQWTDDRYYMHVVNIQADVCCLSGKAPVLPFRPVNPLGGSLPAKQRLKAAMLRLAGIDHLCSLNKTIHKWKQSRS